MNLTRRQILQLIGVSAAAAACGSSADGSDGDLATSEADALAAKKALDKIEHFVILMQENRSFDHFMGALQRDKKYDNRNIVNGTSGDEWNPSPEGHRVHIHDAQVFQLQNPPHSFAAAHRQWDDGKNDKFVIAHAGQYQDQVMAYYDRSQIPFYYWLADHFTVFDNWHASVMGPTGPNRLYLNCGTSAGHIENGPIKTNEPDTIWDHLRAKGVSAKSYCSGSAGLMAHALPNKTAAGKIPFTRIKEFYADAKNGTLPHVAYVEPDYHVNCDHPAHDIRKGQAFVQGVYRALKAGPQWDKTLFVVLYDEHGGFWDHVSPPVAKDAHPDLRRYGFRVPAFAAGGMIKRGHVAQGLHDHTSVLATLSLRFGLPDLSVRAANANTLANVLETSTAARSRDATPAPEPIILDAAAIEGPHESSQEEFEEAIVNGDIPMEFVDDRTPDERMAEWLVTAEELGAVVVQN